MKSQQNRIELVTRPGAFTDAEFSVLDSWWHWLDANLGLDLDMIVYLRTTPEVAYQVRFLKIVLPFFYFRNVREKSHKINLVTWVQCCRPLLEFGLNWITKCL